MGKKMNTFLALLGVLLVLPLVGAKQTENIRVGLLNTITGRFTSKADDFRTSVFMWQRWVNNSGGITLGGKTYQVEVFETDVADDRQDDYPNQINQEVAKFEQGVYGGKFDIIFMPYSSVLTPVTASELHRLGSEAVLITAGSASDSVFVCDDRLLYPCTAPYRRRFPNLWSFLPSASDYMPTTIAVSSIKGAKTVAILYENVEPWRPACQGALRAMDNFDMENVMMHALPNTSAEAATDVVHTLKSLNPDFVVMCTFGGFCKKFVDATRDLDYTPKGIGMTSCITSPSLHVGRELIAPWISGPSTWQKKLTGLDYSPRPGGLVNMFPAEGNISSARKFALEFNEILGRDPTYQAAGALAGMLSVHAAMKLADSKDPKDVNIALRDVSEVSFFGKLAFDPQGRTTTRMLTLQIDGNLDTQIVAPLAVATQDLMYPVPTYRERECAAAGRCGVNGVCNSEGGCTCTLGWTGALCTDEVTEPADMTGAIIGGVLGGVVVVVFVLWALNWKMKQRDNSCAPKGAHPKVAVLFTDIQSSTGLWGRHPERMGPALDQHHLIIRKLIKQYKMYEVKTIGDCFMIVGSDPVAAVKLALGIQSEFMKSTWDSCIDEAYAKFLSEKEETKKQEIQANDRSLWYGLRVRVGMHYGEASAEFDNVTKGYDFYGNTINTCARVEGVAHGGQIVMTDSMVTAFKEKGGDLSSATLLKFGPTVLRGLDQPIVLSQLLPNDFAGRLFPPLRVEIENAIAENSDSDDETGCTTEGGSTLVSGQVGPGAQQESIGGALNILFSPLPKGKRRELTTNLCKFWRAKNLKQLSLRLGGRGQYRPMVGPAAAAHQATALSSPVPGTPVIPPVVHSRNPVSPRTESLPD